MHIENTENNPRPTNRAITWLKRLGVAGFLFFLIKGLLWLLLPTLLVWFARN